MCVVNYSVDVGCVLACDFFFTKRKIIKIEWKTFKNHKKLLFLFLFFLIDSLMGDQVVLWYVAFNITSWHN